MTKPQFVNHNNELTDDALRLKRFLDANMEAMESASADELNYRPGTLKYLFHNQKISGMTSEQFIRETAHSYALNAWNIMEAIETQTAQAEKVEETAQTTTALATELESVKAQLAEALSAIAALQEAKQPEPQKPAKKPAKVETAEEVEDESEAE